MRDIKMKNIKFLVSLNYKFNYDELSIILDLLHKKHFLLNIARSNKQLFNKIKKLHKLKTFS